MRSARGFSLIEMMVVVGILGVMAAIALPLLLPEVHKAQLASDTEAVANLIARTRAEAMRSKRCTRLVVAAATIKAQRLNSFDCDSATPVNRIDTTVPVAVPGGQDWIDIDSLKPESPNVRYSMDPAAGGARPTTPAQPALPGGEIRFRPNGRVFSADAIANAPNLANDDGMVVVQHNRLPTTGNAHRRRVLVNGNGLICTFDRGATPPGGPDFSCP